MCFCNVICSLLLLSSKELLVTVCALITIVMDWRTDCKLLDWSLAIELLFFRTIFITTAWCNSSWTWSCDILESAEKGVEFSILVRNESWVPLAYYHYDYTRRPEIGIGNFSEQPSKNYSHSVRIRGYNIPAYQVDNSISATLDICDPAYLQQGHIQFRWLETSRHPIVNKRVFREYRPRAKMIKFFCVSV